MLWIAKKYSEAKFLTSDSYYHVILLKKTQAWKWWKIPTLAPSVMWPFFTCDRNEILNCQGFWSKTQWVCYIFQENFFNSKILQSSQNFEYKCSGCPENEAQSPNFGCFGAFFDIILDVHFGTSLQPRTLICVSKNSSTMHLQVQ